MFEKDIPSHIERFIGTAKELGRNMLRGFAAANQGEAPYRSQAILNEDSVMQGEFPLMGRLLANESNTTASLE